MNKPRYGDGFHSVYARGKLTLGTTVPIEAYDSPVPQMHNQLALIQKVEQAGFAALWCRDVPLLDPSFGDAGQIYDPWVWLGYIAAHTTTLALGTGSIILPLRSPVDLAKAASSVDQLSQGRLIMGVATGDRPVEYSVYSAPFETRDEAFREVFEFIRLNSHRPEYWDDQLAVASRQVDLLPKCYAGDLPLFVTGNSRQSVDWIAEHASGWLMYPRPIQQQAMILQQWHEALDKNNQTWKPFSQSLYIDLADDPDEPPRPIHLGFRFGRNPLIDHLHALQEIGVNHVTFNLRFCKRPIEAVLDELAEYVIPLFPRNNLQGNNLQGNKEQEKAV